MGSRIVTDDIVHFLRPDSALLVISATEDINPELT